MIAKQIEQRVSLALAIRSYLQTRERLHQANEAFIKACEELRAQAGREGRVLAHVDYRYWLLDIDAEGNFDLEEIELL